MTLPSNLRKRPGFGVCILLAFFSSLFCVFGDDPQSKPQTTTDGGMMSLMTDKMQRELFDALDLSRSKLESVREAAEKGDFIRADHELAKYLKDRTDVPWKIDPRHLDRNVPFNKKVADDAANGRFSILGVPPARLFPDRVDWLYNDTRDRKDTSYDPEWQYVLCRMPFWGDLAAAYRATGDERYAQAWVRQLRSFITSCPTPDHRDNDQVPDHRGSAWRTLDSGIRISETWPAAYHSFLFSPAFTDEDIALYLYSCLMHARYLESFPTHGNWLTVEMSGLYTVGVLYPEFKEANDWRKFAVEKLYAETSRQFLPDGAQNELTPGYHNLALNSVLNIPTLAKASGHLGEIPDDYVKRMEKAFDYDLYLMAPDRFEPKLNDSGMIGAVGCLNRGLQFFPERTDYRWITSDGKKGQPPADTSHAFPWAGYFVMRSGWERDANYLIFDAGPLGNAHEHQDKLNVVLYSYGKEVLFDSGGGSYEKSKWRDYAISTFSHNTVLVDGLPQHRSWSVENKISKNPIDARWESTPSFDFAAGVYNNGYGAEENRPATHCRRVLYIKPDLFLVVDTLLPNDETEHSYQARWNLLPTKVQRDKSLLSVTTLAAGQPNLTILPLEQEGLDIRVVSAQTEPELLGWNVLKDVVPPNVPATTVIHQRKGVGRQTFVTLLIPLRASASEPTPGVKTLGSESYVVTWASGRSLNIAVDPNPAGGIEAVETSADGTKGRQIRAGYPKAIAR
jgi:Heparinase II/III N-terminus/Heparinase II/III-like protein